MDSLENCPFVMVNIPKTEVIESTFGGEPESNLDFLHSQGLF